MEQNRDHPTNFIYQIIDDALKTNPLQSIKTRFPPEPNGYLHIGHAKSICLNFGIAQNYHGQCYLRFDDTNPAKESLDYVDAIQQDIYWLGFNWDGVVRYASDYFELLYQYAIELIKKGMAYVDQLSTEEIRLYRGTLVEIGKNSPYRDRTIEENLALFNRMKLGEFAEGSACLRARIDMKSPFIVLRDPVLYRIKHIHHYRSAQDWHIYPMYDFAHPISDAIEGISHSLCTLEFQDNRRLYDWILEQLAFTNRPRQYEFSRLNLEYTVLSKRKLTQLVNEKIVDSWDDPRMPTISGMRRRGYPAAAIREFCRRIGVTKQDNLIELQILSSCIREELNNNSPRAMAVLEPLKVIIANFPDDTQEMLSVANHPEKSSLGHRQLPFGREIYIERSDFQEQANKQYKRLVLGQTVRLRYAYVITAQRVEKNDHGDVTVVYCTYDAQTLARNPKEGKPRGVIHWVCAAHACPAKFRLFDNLFNISNPGSSEEWLSNINAKSLIVKQGVVEPALQNAHQEQTYQFERLGYFCADNQLSHHKNLVFNRTIELRDVWATKT